VIAPLLDSALGVVCFVNESFWHGYIRHFYKERLEKGTWTYSNSPGKNSLAMDLSNCDLGCQLKALRRASIPSLFFVNATWVFWFLLNKKKQVEISSGNSTRKTNSMAKKLKMKKNFWSLPSLVHYPLSRLILRSKTDNGDIIKALQTLWPIEKPSKICLKTPNSVYARNRYEGNVTIPLVCRSLKLQPKNY